MTLTEFLLARIAEDEAWIEETEDGIWALGDEYPPSASAIQSYQRFTAECEAKRRIVNEIEGTRQTATYTTRLLTILLYLAMPYADHPDYKQEWTP